MKWFHINKKQPKPGRKERHFVCSTPQGYLRLGRVGDGEFLTGFDEDGYPEYERNTLWQVESLGIIHDFSLEEIKEFCVYWAYISLTNLPRKNIEKVVFYRPDGMHTNATSLDQAEEAPKPEAETFATFNSRMRLMGIIKDPEVDPNSTK